MITEAKTRLAGLRKAIQPAGGTPDIPKA